MKLKDRVAIVTGGGKGIGQEICLGLVKEGAKIVIAEIDIENSEKAKKKIIEAGSEAIIIKTDVSNQKSINEMVDQTIKHYGKIDILINNAGIRHVKKLLDHTKQDWDDMISVNLTAPFLVSQAVIPHMIKNGKFNVYLMDRVRALAGAESQNIEIIFVSHDGETASILGNAFAEDLGFKNVYVLDGGIKAWISEKKALVSFLK